MNAVVDKRFFLKQDDDVFMQEEPVMDVTTFMQEYQAFCTKYEYARHATFTDLGEIKETLVLAAVKLMGPLSDMDVIPAQNFEPWRRYAVQENARQDWQDRKSEAKRLFKQADHLQHDDRAMTAVTLKRMKSEFDALSNSASIDTQHLLSLAIATQG